MWVTYCWHGLAFVQIRNKIKWCKVWGVKLPCGLDWGTEWSIYIGSADLTVGSFGGTIFEWCKEEPNGLPTIVLVPYWFNEDSAGIAVISGTDPEASSVTYRIKETPEHGEVVLINPSSGTFRYTPKLHYSGVDVISVVANDGKEDGPEQALTLRIFGIADAPEMSVSGMLV